LLLKIQVIHKAITKPTNEASNATRYITNNENTMIQIAKAFTILVLWFILIDFAMLLINYPSDIAFYGGWATILIGIFCTYFLITYKPTNKTKNNEKTI